MFLVRFLFLENKLVRYRIEKYRDVNIPCIINENKALLEMAMHKENILENTPIKGIALFSHSLLKVGTPSLKINTFQRFKYG